jgi:hypothetical protein
MDHSDSRPAVGLPPLPVPGMTVPVAKPPRTRFRSGSGFCTAPAQAPQKV